MGIRLKNSILHLTFFSWILGHSFYLIYPVLLYYVLVKNFPNLDKTVLTVQNYVNQKPFNKPADFLDILEVVRNCNNNFKLELKEKRVQELGKSHSLK